MKDLVSIIIPLHNNEDTIGETMESIISQSYPHWEMIIVDDASTDRSQEIVRDFMQKDSRIQLTCLAENRGAGEARNIAIEKAGGRYIAFCDADDCWLPTKLEKQLEFIKTGGYPFTFTSYHTRNNHGKINGTVNCPRKVNRWNILVNNNIKTLTAVYDTRITGKCFMPSYRRSQDWCLWIDLINRFGQAHGLQIPLAVYRQRKYSLSYNKLKRFKANFTVYNKFCGFNAVASFAMLSGVFLPYYFYKKIKQKISSFIRKGRHFDE